MLSMIMSYLVPDADQAGMWNFSQWHYSYTQLIMTLDDHETWSK